MNVLLFIIETLKPFRLYFWGMLGVVFLVSIDANLKPYLIKLLIDTASGSKHLNIWTIITIYMLAQFALVCTWRFNDWLFMKYYAPHRIHIVNLFTSKLTHYSYSFFQNNLAGSIVAKINDAFTSISYIVATANLEFISFMMITIFTGILLSQIHIFFALGLIAWVGIFTALTYFGLKKINYTAKAYAESKARFFGQISDYISNILNVRLFATSNFENNKFNSSAQKYINKSYKMGYLIMNFYFIQGVIVSIYILGLLFGLIYLKERNIITPGDFALVFMLNFQICDKLFTISNKLRDFITYWGSVGQALTLFSNAPEIQDKPHATTLQIDQGEIVFNKVKFEYKGTETLFENKSVTIAPGKKIGLVGYSGSGKSTFVNLILRLYDVASGQILIDGQDIRDITQNSLRAAIGLIPQDPSLFHRSLMDNIRYGRIEATDEEVIEAAKRAHAHEFITKLPQGYESLVGERGIKLSGGQRQRIAIARVILKNPPILILDEATSQLDSITEIEIQESLWELMKGKTTIVIAHRLSTLLNMDRILVFDQGKIVEDGTHKSLLANNGLYRTLWDTQVGGFLPDNK